MIQPGSLQRWKIGEALQATKLNEPVDVLNRMRGFGPANQVIGHPIVEGGGAGNIEKFQVMNEIDRGDGPHIMQDDYFYAKRLSTGDTRIKVAKPHKLRTTPWDTHLRQKAGLSADVYLEYYDVRVTYVYPQRLYAPLDFNKRWATREDEANIRAVQIIWPPYGTDISPDTPLDIIKVVQIGEEATGIEGVDWEDTNDSGRVWSLFPAAFESPASAEAPQ